MTNYGQFVKRNCNKKRRYALRIQKGVNNSGKETQQIDIETKENACYSRIFNNNIKG